MEILERYGVAFQRLAEGDLAPRTDGQRRFVEVADGVREPETIYEKAWSKYLRRIEWENDPQNRAAMGPRRKFPDDREDWKRMAGAQWGQTIRRSRGFDD